MRTTSISLGHTLPFTCGSLLTLRSIANFIRRINHHQTLRLIARSQNSIRTQKTLATNLAGKSRQFSTFSFVSWNATQLSQYPLVTKALTGGAIAAGGDFCCRTILEGSNDDDNDNGQSTTTRWEEYDPLRTFRFGQLYVGLKSKYTALYGMKTESEASSTMEDFVREHGAPYGIRNDNSRTQLGNNFRDVLRRYNIKQSMTEPHHPHENPAERRIQDVKKHTNKIMDRTGAPANL